MGGYPSPRYTAEFKAKAVELYRSAGPEAACAGVARSLGCDAGPLSKWVRPASNDQPGDPEMNPFQIQEENEILLKASAFFAGRQL